MEKLYDNGQSTVVSAASGTDQNADDMTTNEQLLIAVSDNDLDKVEKLLQKGADMNANECVKNQTVKYGYNDYTPAILAAEEGYVDLLNALLKIRGMDVNRQNTFGSTALHKASERGHLEVVQALLPMEGIDVNVGDKYGFTPLQLASRNGYSEIVEALLEAKGILINKKNKEGQTPLHLAAQKGRTKAVVALLQAPGIKVNEKDGFNSHTALHLATDLHHPEVVEVLLYHPETDVNAKDKYGQTPLHTSAYHGNLRVVEMLLENGINVNEKTLQDRTAVYWASKKGHFKVVEMVTNHIKAQALGNQSTRRRQMSDLSDYMRNLTLLERSEEVTGVNAELHAASQKGDFVRVKELLKLPGIDVNCKDRLKNSPLHLSALNGHTEVVKALLEIAGIDVNAKNKDDSKLYYPVHIGDDPNRGKLDIGQTALFLAVQRGHLEVVRVLVANKTTDVNTTNKYGTSCVCLAVQRRDTKMVEVLLSHPDIDVNAKNVCNDHFSPLHSAAEMSNLEMVKILIGHKNINVNAKDMYFKCIPLHFAAKHGDLEMVKVLLDHPKIDVNAKDRFNETPLDLAKKRVDQSCAKALMKAQQPY